MVCRKVLLTSMGFLILLAGCATRATSTTARTAVEQLLLSSAVDRALEKFDLPEVAGRRVYIDFTRLKATDAEYVQVATRARFAQIGAVLVEKAEDADLIAEVASGALGMEHKTGVVGLPGLPVPSSPIPTPDMPLYRTVEQTAIMKLMIFVHEKGKFVAANHYYAKSDRDESFVLVWRFQRADDVREGWEKADLKLHPSSQK